MLELLLATWRITCGGLIIGAGTMGALIAGWVWLRWTFDRRWRT